MQHFGVCKKRAFGIPMPLPKLLNDKYQQAVRIMKVTAFILLVCSLHVSAAGYSQSITLSEKDATLIKVFKAIEKQTDFIFFYNIEWISKTEKVNIDVKNTPLQQALDLLFKNQPITYSITGKMITVLPKKSAVASNNMETPPPINIHGKVVDENGKPVAGVTVMVNGTKKQTITDENGEFVFSGVETNAVLAFSSVNMETFEINVLGKSEILAKLKTKTSELDEVQVIAYGTITKRLNTGNVSTVKATEIERQPVNNALLALQGRVPGLLITQGSGLPGTAIQVRIEGQNSLLKGNDPLYVIDGVPYITQLQQGLGSVLGTGRVLNGIPSYGNPFSYINPGDIESIDVLKDADATAIYGSRAANGAILITTKKGKAGQTKLDLNLQTGWGKVPKQMDLLNTRQYLEMRREAITNDGGTVQSSDYDLTLWDTTRNTNWQKELIGGTALYSDIQATISGGNSNTQYLLGSGYHRETTVFPGDFSDQKASVHFNVANTSTNQKFKLQLSGNYLVDNNNIMYKDITYLALTRSPDAPSLYNANGDLNWAPDSTGKTTFDNPISYILSKYKNKTNNLIGNVVLSYEILRGLEIKANLGYTNMQSNEVTTFPLTAVWPESRTTSSRGAQYASNSINSWIAEPHLRYLFQLKKGTLEALAGTTFQKNNNKGQIISGTGYTSDLVLEDIKSAGNLSVASTVDAIYKYSAVFGRLNYNWDNKYIVNLTARRDGSSRFGDKNRFHDFSSVAGTWIFTEEKAVQRGLPFLSFGKVRGSYGTTGNDQIGDYQYMNLYTPTNVNLPYQSTRGLAANGLENPYLMWEETKKLQFGLDLGFLKDKVLVTANYFHNRTSGQLLNYLLPITTGFDRVTKNFPATIQNSGWEMSLSYTILKSNTINWTSRFNITIPQNKLVSFDNLATSPYATSYIIGEPVTVTKVYHSLGVDPQTGKYQFADSLGNPTFTPDYNKDRNVIINTSPKFYGGFQNTIRIYGFQLDFLFQFVKQLSMDNFRFGVYPGYFSAGAYNQPVSVLQRWKKPGDVTNIQRYNADFGIADQLSYAQSSDAVFVDGSYIRLKNASLSWLVDESLRKKMHLKGCRLYLQGQNLLTITNYKGLDPETANSTSLPPLRVLTIGMQITL